MLSKTFFAFAKSGTPIAWPGSLLVGHTITALAFMGRKLLSANTTKAFRLKLLCKGKNKMVNFLQSKFPDEPRVLMDAIDAFFERIETAEK